MRDPKTEAFLQRGRWVWAYEQAVPLSSIDTDHARDNPARLNRRFDEERVLQYAEEMDDGVEFPAVVLLTPSDHGVKPFDIATGLHRLSAAELCRKGTRHADAYVITEPDRYRRELLTRSLNTIEGRGADQSEQIMHIIYLHEHHKQPIATLCKEWHIKEGSVRHYYRAEQCKRRAKSLGVQLSDTRLRLSQSLLGQMNALHSDKVFKEFAEFINRHATSVGVVENLCRQLKDVRDEAKALALIQTRADSEQQARQNASQKFGRIRPGPAHAMIANATRFTRQVRTTGINQLGLAALSKEDTVKTLDLMEDIRAVIEGITGEIKRIEAINAAAAKSGLHAAE